MLESSAPPAWLVDLEQQVRRQHAGRDSPSSDEDSSSSDGTPQPAGGALSSTRLPAWLRELEQQTRARGEAELRSMALRKVRSCGRPTHRRHSLTALSR